MKLHADALTAAHRGESELTERQREILGLVVLGHTNGEIADLTSLSLSTVKWHMSEILTKLGLSSRDEAALYWDSRNSPVRRAARWARGLLALPALKWAAGGTAAALAAGAVGLGLWLASGDARTAGEPLPPFELSAVIRTHENGALAFEEKVTWKYNDRRHWIIESVRSDGRVIIDVSDGFRHLTGGGAARDSLTWTESPLDGPEASGPFQSLLGGLGPRGYQWLDAIVKNGNRSRWGQSSRIAGPEKLLGRDVSRIESSTFWPTQDPASPETDNGELELTLGVGQIWADDETLFILKFELPHGDRTTSGEVTTLKFAKQSQHVFSQSIPAGAAAAGPPPSPEPAPIQEPSDRFGIATPARWYQLSALPAAFEVGGLRTLHQELHKRTGTVVTLLTTDAQSPSASRERSLVLAQEPATSAAIRQGEPVLLTSGLTATLGEEAGRLVLSFADADVTVTIRGNRVSREELIAFANSLEKRP